MKYLVLATTLIACVPVHAEGTLITKERVVLPADMAQRTPRPAHTAAFEAGLREAVLRASNRQRRRAGAPPLTHDPALAAAATRYSRRMGTENFFGHVAPDGEALDKRLPPGVLQRYQSLGENLWYAEGALDWKAGPIAEQIATDWLASPTHRGNLLLPSYTLGGVGIAVVGEKVVISMLYASPLPASERGTVKYITLDPNEIANQ